MIRRVSVLTERVLNHFYKFLYHGAIDYYKILQPYGLDFGNAFQKPGFSLFTFVDKEDSIGWAVFQVTKKLLEEYGIGKTSGCNWSKEVVLTRDTYNRLVAILDGIPNQKKTYYVYTVKVEKDFVLGFGHSTNTKNCVTIRNKNIVPYKTDRYILTKDALDAHSCIIEREEDFTKEELLKMNGINGRFLTPFMINDPMNNWKVYKQIKQAILSGEITYDDDSLNDYIKKNHIPISRLFNESVYKSSLNKSFKKKGHKSLSDFKRIKIADMKNELPDQYKKQIKIKDFDEYDHGYIWVDENDDFVALCTVSDLLNTGKFSWMKWISGIEVSKKYKGYGLSYQLLDVAVNELKGNTLSVASDNKIAIHLYEKYGFVIDTDKKNSKYYLMYLPSSKKEGVYTEAKRSELPDEAFGIPEDRKFPLDTKKRVISAIRLFGHAEEGKKKELAKRIAKRAADYGIKISETTQVYKYLHMDNEKEMTESAVVKFDPNHKTKKSSKKFKFIDLKDPAVDKYLNDDSYCKKHIKWIHDSAKGEIVVDEDSDTFSGYIFIWKTKNTGFIAPLHVFEKYRGCGLGTRLLKDAIQKYDAIDLCVLKTNKVAIKLYKDNGFVIIGDGNNKKEYWMKLKSKLTDEEKTKVITESVDDLSPVLQDIIKVNHKLNYFEYIIVVNGRVITQIKREDFDHYHTMSPREFKKYHGGICWDYAMFEAFYFKKYFPRIKTKTFFTAFECDGTPTHTFLLFYLNNKCYWFESSWKSHCGVYEFDSEDAALTYITKQLRSEKKNVKYTFVTEYNAMDTSLQNLPGDEYVDKLLNQEEYKFSNVYSEMREVFREDIRL